MNFNWILCLTVFAAINIQPSLAKCEVRTVENVCNYTITCTRNPERVRNPNTCGASHTVTFIITQSILPVLSRGFFSATNFDARVRSIIASDNIWTTIAPSVFKYYHRCLHMYLSNNQIETIEGQAFDDLQLMNFLNLSRNSIKELMPNTFMIQENNIEVLDLSYNKLTALNTELNEMSNLTELYLQNNKLESISDDSFQNLGELKHLYLQNNQLKTLNLTLANLKKLITLDLSGNCLVKLSGFELNNLGSINMLNFTNQNITGIREEAFADMESLLNLNLSRNNIRTVEDSSFVNTSIRVLDLSYNNLQDLSFLKNCLPNLTEFIVSNNNIQIISKSAFSNQPQIVHLDLSMNNIIRIEEVSLPLLKLQYLNVAGNQMNGTVENNVFSPAKYLRFLDLSNSNITRIYDLAFVDLPVLEKLNLSHNEIEDIGSNNFKGVNNMHNLDISYNKLTKLRIINTLTNLKALYLNNNNLTDISGPVPLLYLDVSNKILPNLTALNLAHNNIKNFNNPNVNSLSTLIDLNLSYNQLISVKLSYFRDLKTVNLSNNNLTNINSMFLQNVENLESLDMSRNKMTVLPPGIFQIMKKLKYLNLSANLLTKLSYGTFEGLVSTEVVDISKNNLTSLDEAIFHECNELNTLIIDYNRIKLLDISKLLLVLSKLRRISLGGNPISCNEIVRSIQPVISKESTSSRRIEVTSIDKIYHEDNVHGIRCGDNVSSVTTTEPEFKSDSSSSTVTIIWCSVLTIVLIAIIISIVAVGIHRKYYRTRYLTFPVDTISRNSLQFD